MEKLAVEKEDKEKKGFDKYEVESFTRTLIEAEEIKADPKKMAAVKKELSKKKKAINSIDDLRRRREEIVEEDMEESD